MKFATIYTKPNCPQCDYLKKIIDSKSYVVEYDEITGDNIGMLKDLGAKTAPVILFEGRVISIQEYVKAMES